MNNVSKAESKILKACRKYGVVIDYDLHFTELPEGKKHPAELKSAIKTMLKYGMKVLFIVKDAEEAVSETVKAVKK